MQTETQHCTREHRKGDDEVVVVRVSLGLAGDMREMRGMGGKTVINPRDTQSEGMNVEVIETMKQSEIGKMRLYMKVLSIRGLKRFVFSLLAILIDSHYDQGILIFSQ